ncbi:MAG TPA: phosphoenolpyruvate hydrolase family protein [Solirubrobacteraceae bacterium]|nr:phosphoenolpyruvate hydrolase family protein [Solirubrobacteraceae bacterium]
MIGERAFTREQIVERLRSTLAEHTPIVAAAAGVGIIAKCAELAGADLILVIASGKSRHLGVPTTVNIGNATAMTVAMYPEIDNVVDQTPVIGGIEGTDGSRRRLTRTVDEYRALGFDGITNFPTAGAFPGWGDSRRDIGEGYEREYELIGLARERDLFTVGQAYVAEHAAALAGAGADVVVARCGLTIGGMSGAVGVDTSLARAAAHVQELIGAARAERPDVIVLAQGGPFARPEDTDHLYAHTDAQGILGESAIERIPIEEYVSAAIRDLKAQELSAAARAVA